MPARPDSAVLVLPRASIQQAPPVAALVTTAGWASGVERTLGKAWIATVDGPLSSAEAYVRSTRSRAELAATDDKQQLKKALPVGLRLFLRDLQRIGRSVADSGAALHGPW